MRRLWVALFLTMAVALGCSSTARQRLKTFFFEIPDAEGATLRVTDAATEAPLPVSMATFEGLLEPYSMAVTAPGNCFSRAALKESLLQEDLGLAIRQIGLPSCS